MIAPAALTTGIAKAAMMPVKVQPERMRRAYRAQVDGVATTIGYHPVRFASSGMGIGARAPATWSAGP